MFVCHHAHSIVASGRQNLLRWAVRPNIIVARAVVNIVELVPVWQNTVSFTHLPSHHSSDALGQVASRRIAPTAWTGRGRQRFKTTNLHQCRLIWQGLGTDRLRYQTSTKVPKLSQAPQPHPRNTRPSQASPRPSRCNSGIPWALCSADLALAEVALVRWI